MSDQTKRLWTKRGYSIYFWVVVALSCVLVSSPFINYAHAQVTRYDENASAISMLKYQVAELKGDEGIGGLRAEVRALTVKVDEGSKAILILQTLLNSTTFWNQLATGSVGLVGLERAWGLIKKRREGSQFGSE